MKAASRERFWWTLLPGTSITPSGVREVRTVSVSLPTAAGFFIQYTHSVRLRTATASQGEPAAWLEASSRHHARNASWDSRRWGAVWSSWPTDTRVEELPPGISRSCTAADRLRESIVAMRFSGWHAVRQGKMLKHHHFFTTLPTPAKDGGDAAANSRLPGLAWVAISHC